LVAAACGGGDTPSTAIPATTVPDEAVATTASVVAPPTATTAADAVVEEEEEEIVAALPTAVIVPTHTALAGVPTATAAPTATPRSELRPIEDWTCDEPGTRQEVEAELENHRGEQLNFVGWGGTYQDSQRKAWFNPIFENWGIIVNEESPMMIGAVRAAGELGDSNLPPWNIAAVDGATTDSWGRTGVLEELDCAIVDTSGWPEHLQRPWFGGGAIAWGWVYAYSTDTYPDGSVQPQNMEDVFDADTLPGRRGFWRPEGWKLAMRWANLSLDPDLLSTAEGKLSLLQISDEQFEIGYEVLEGFRDNITNWSSGYSDCPQALMSGDLDMCVYDTGMAFDAWADDMPTNVCWTCGIIAQTDQMSIIKGTSLDPELFELTQLVMAWMSLPEIHPLSSQYIGYGPVNMDSLQYMDDPMYDDAKQFLPTSPQNFPNALFTDEIYDGSIAMVQGDRWELWQGGAYLGIE